MNGSKNYILRFDYMRFILKNKEKKTNFYEKAECTKTLTIFLFTQLFIFNIDAIILRFRMAFLRPFMLALVHYFLLRNFRLQLTLTLNLRK